MQLSPGSSLILSLEPEAGDLKSIGDLKIQGFENADSDINITCICLVHGFLDGPGTQPATLVVLRFNLTSNARGRQFKSFRPKIQLQQLNRKEQESKGLLSKITSPWSSGKTTSQKATRPASLPWVEDGMFEPGFTGPRIITEVKRKRQEQHAIQAAIGIQPPVPSPLTGNMSWTSSSTSEYEETYRYTVTGGVRGLTKNDTVYFNANQEPEIKDGIHVLQVAFLLGRDNMDDFQMEIQVDANADFTYKTKEILSRVMKAKKNTATFEVFPSKPSPVQKVPDGVDADHLRNLEKNNRSAFIALTSVPAVELSNPPAGG